MLIIKYIKFLKSSMMYKHFYILKDYGQGYVFEFMSMLDGLVHFINKCKRNNSHGLNEHFEIEEFVAFKNYMKATRKYYSSRSSAKSFEEILQKEKRMFDMEWDRLPEESKYKIELMTRILDSEGLD